MTNSDDARFEDPRDVTSEHIDAVWRSAIATRARTLREEATRLINQLTDADAKDLFYRSILIPLDDVDSFVAGSPARLPGESQWEESWLSMGEYLLDIAQRGIVQLKLRLANEESSN